MSLEQAKAFVEGLDKLWSTYSENSHDTTEEYFEYVKEAGTEFQEKSHDYAKDMTQFMADLVQDVKTLYEEVYPADEEEIEEEEEEEEQDELD